MNNLIEYFAKQRIFAYLITVFVVIAGVFSSYRLRKEVFPNVDFDVVTVTTIYAGASPEEIEKIITNPLEMEIKEVDGIKKIQSVSTESRSYIVIQVDPDVSSGDAVKVDVQDVVDRWSDLPRDAERPIITKVESKNSPLIEVTVAADLSDLELREKAKAIESEMESIPGVAKAILRGERKLEYKVEAIPKKLSQFRVSLDELVRSIGAQNISIPGGSLEVSGGDLNQKEKIVRTVGDYKNLKDIEDTVIRANDSGTAIRIKDVANVTADLAKANLLNNVNGEKSISITILKKEKADAVELVEQVKKKLVEISPKLGSQVKTSYINDLSEFIKRRLDVLTGNLWVGLLLVIVILPLLLPVRATLVVTLGIPFSFLSTIFIFNYLGYSINLLNMLGFIIVSGMLVDNSIVVADNALRIQQEEGKDAESAVIEGTKQVWMSIFASIMTTVLAFAPLMGMSGIFGKFVKQVPLAVLYTLVINLLQAFFIVPAIYIAVMGARSKIEKMEHSKFNFPKRFEAFWDSVVVPRYVAYLEMALRRRYWVSFVLVLMLGGSLGLAKTMKFILFPPDGVEIFFAKMQAPVGTSLDQMKQIVKPIEDKIKSLGPVEVKDFVTTIGMIQQDPNDPNTKRGSEYAQIAVYMTPEAERTRTATEIVNYLRESTVKPEKLNFLTFDRVSQGPPVGRPVSIGIRGDNYESLMPVIEEVKSVLVNVKGVKDIQDSYILGKEEIIIDVDPVLSSSAQLNVSSVGNTVRAAYDGIVASTVKKSDEEIDVRVSLSSEARSSEDVLKNIEVPNPRGYLIRLGNIAKFRKSQGPASLEHEAYKRQIRVTADVDLNQSSSQEANKEIQKLIPDFKKKYPDVSFVFGGENEDTQESLVSLAIAASVAVFGIFFILILSFQSLLQPLLILVTIPMGLISVILTFFIHGKPISFMGILGIISLAGVAVNNAIIFLDFVNQNRKNNMDRFQSITESARMRIRPIFLTTATTVAGLLPTAYGIGGEDKFVMPIALALGWGLGFGSLLTAFIFPSIIAVLDDVEEFSRKIYSRLGSGIK